MIKQLIKKIYKKFIYFLFEIYFGKIVGIFKNSKKNEVQIDKVTIDNIIYDVYSCKKAILYTDRIYNTALIKNNQIVDGPSFQYNQNNINQKSSNNSVFFKGTPAFRKKIAGSVFSLLVGGGGNSNYWHWLFDVLPKLYIYKKSKFFNEDIYLLFPGLEQKFQFQTLELLGLKKNKCLSSKKFKHFFAENIIATSHTYNFLNDPLKDSLNIPSWIFNYLRKEFLNTAFLENDRKKFSKNIYISRKDGKSLRYIINETEVFQTLKKFDFEEVILSDYNFSEQVKIFSNANYIVGLHGAGFANLVFCKPNTKVLELMPNTAGNVIKNLAINNRLIYNCLSVKPETLNFNNQSGDIFINSKNLANILEKK